MSAPKNSDDEVRKQADELYQRVCKISQVSKGAFHSPYDVWKEAVRQLDQEQVKPKRKRRGIISRIMLPFSWLERRVIEPTAVWMDEADIFRIIEKLSTLLEAVGVIAIPIAIWWFTETAQKSREQQAQAERTARERQERAVRAQTTVQDYLNQISNILATGKLKNDKDLQSIVRVNTLALLDSPDLQPDPNLAKEDNWRSDRKGQTIRYLLEAGLLKGRNTALSITFFDLESPVISLAGANLEGANLSWTFLSNPNFYRANLSYATLYRAYLSSPNFTNAYLKGVYLVEGRFEDASFSGADLTVSTLDKANLRGANFGETNLWGASLKGADLDGAILNRANLTNANLSESNLSGSNFSGAKLENAFLTGANFEGTNLLGANLKGALGMTVEQINRAKLCMTELPLNTTFYLLDNNDINPNRDCQELGITP